MRQRNLGDAVFYRVTQFFAFMILALVAVTAYEMYRTSSASIDAFGFGFIFAAMSKKPSENASRASGPNG